MMTDQAAITQAIVKVAVDVMKAALQAMAVTRSVTSSGTRSEPTNAGPKIGGPTLR